MPKITQNIGFLGSGQMATALARGFLAAGMVSADQVIASDVVPAARQSFTAATGARGVDSNREVISRAAIVFLAVKPQHFAAACSGLRAALGKEHLVVSIVAGIPLARIAEALGPEARLVRVMPNTPCLVGCGASAYSLGQNATADDGKLVGQLLSATGLALEVDEKHLDAVTGLSGSGPAFVYLLIEALSDGGVRMGLPRDVAMRLAAQTVAGAARMVLETGEHPGVLKDRVASPGGTTIAGLQVLEDRAVRGALVAAVQAATERSAELGKKEKG